jgi:hypothetical protein
MIGGLRTLDDRKQPQFTHLQLLEDEEVIAHARALEADIAVTNRRLAIVEAERLAMAIDIEELRRIQFDIEKDRPASLVVVPESPSHPPAVLSVPVEQYEPIARALVIIGQRLGGLS